MQNNLLISSYKTPGKIEKLKSLECDSKNKYKKPNYRAFFTFYCTIMQTCWPAAANGTSVLFNNIFSHGWIDNGDSFLKRTTVNEPVENVASGKR